MTDRKMLVPDDGDKSHEVRTKKKVEDDLEAAPVDPADIVLHQPEPEAEQEYESPERNAGRVAEPATAAPPTSIKKEDNDEEPAEMEDSADKPVETL